MKAAKRCLISTLLPLNLHVGIFAVSHADSITWTLFSKFNARLRANVALYNMAFDLSRLRSKMDRVGQVIGPHNLGRLSH
jgi:hypothetical protein